MATKKVSKAERVPMHWIFYGGPGTYKSTTLATFCKPLIVWMFDPLGKHMPYVRYAKRQGWVQEWFKTPEGMSALQFSNGKGEVQLQIEFYHDTDPDKPTAWTSYRKRMSRFKEELDYWAAAGLDSVTSMELAARNHQRFNINPDTKEPRQWFSGSTDALEHMLCTRFAGYPIDIVLLCHTSEDKDELAGGFVYGLAVPGRLSRNRGLPACYAEIYRSYVEVDDKGNRWPMVQTQTSKRFFTATQINPDDPCDANYDAIWDSAREED